MLIPHGPRRTTICWVAILMLAFLAAVSLVINPADSGARPRVLAGIHKPRRPARVKPCARSTKVQRRTSRHRRHRRHRHSAPRSRRAGTKHAVGCSRKQPKSGATTSRKPPKHATTTTASASTGVPLDPSPTGSGGGSSIGGCNGCSYNGDLSTGDFSQYGDCHGASGSNLTDGNYPSDYAIDTTSGSLGSHSCGSLGLPSLVRDITAPGGYAGRYLVNSSSYGNDGEGLITENTVGWPTTPPDTSGVTQGYQGKTEWYRDEVYFPAGFHPASSSDWNFVWEFHVFPNFNGAYENLSVAVVTDNSDGGPSGGDRLSLRILGGGTPSDPIVGTYGTDTANPTWHQTWKPGPNIQTGHWYDMVMEVHWDYSSAGSVTWWLDGAKEASYTGPTLWYATNNGGGSAGPTQTYEMHGYYTSASNPGPNYVYHAETLIGATAASIGENLP